MSNVTFMIGNGFDLVCGLKSRYIDTYDGYIASNSSTDIVRKFKETIDKDILSWADFEMRLAEYAKTLGAESDIIACIRDYEEYLSEYLIKEQNAFWREHGAFDKPNNSVLYEIGRSLGQFYYGLTNNDMQLIKDVLYSSSYIRYDFINFNYTNVFDRMAIQALNHGYLRTERSITIQGKDLIHIHGTLGNDITLGIDNENQLLGLPYNISRKAKRCLIKPFFLQSFDKQRMEKAKSVIYKSNIICIFGLSLGDSDLTWREILASWLRENKWHHLVCFNHKYMSKNYHPTAVTIKMDDEEDCKEILFKKLFGDLIDNDTKEELLSRIHVPVGTKLFNVRKALDVLKSSNSTLEK